MESEKVEFEATDLTLHGRNLRPTQSFERAQEKARSKGSSTVRVYGAPMFTMDQETGNIYFGTQFSEDIIKRVQSGQLKIGVDTPRIVDEETKKRMADKKKRWLKTLTRVWRKDS